MAILKPEQIGEFFPTASPNLRDAMAEICEINALVMGRIQGLDPNGADHKRVRRFETEPDELTLRRLFMRAVDQDGTGRPLFHVGTVEWERNPAIFRPDRKREENLRINGKLSASRKVLSGFGLREESRLGAFLTGKSTATAMSNDLRGYHRLLINPCANEAAGLPVERFDNQTLAFLLQRFTQRLRQASQN